MQAMVHKTLHRKIKIGQLGQNAGVQEGQALRAPLVTSVVLLMLVICDTIDS